MIVFTKKQEGDELTIEANYHVKCRVKIDTVLQKDRYAVETLKDRMKEAIKSEVIRWLSKEIGRSYCISPYIEHSIMIFTPKDYVEILKNNPTIQDWINSKEVMRNDSACT